MRAWRIRAIGGVLIAVLGGAPAVAAACNVWCESLHGPANAMIEAGHGSHASMRTHASHTPEVEAHHAAASPASHAHHHAMPADMRTASPASTVRLDSISGPECCTDLWWHDAVVASPLTSTTLTSTLPVVALPSLISFECSVRQTSHPCDVSPPGTRSQARSPLVLRI